MNWKIKKGFVMPRERIEVDEGFCWCSACKTVKEEKEFYKDSSRPSGFQTYCKKCNNLISAERIRKKKARNK